MAATSPDVSRPSVRAGGGRTDDPPAPAPDASRSRLPAPPPLGLDTAPLLDAVGLLGDDEDEECLDTGDVVLREGPESATYIYVDLAGVDPALLPAGGELTVEGLDTPAPALRLPGGRILAGTWSEPVGSLLFVHAAAATAEGREGGRQEREESAITNTISHSDNTPIASPCALTHTHAPGSYLCHTEKVLVFRADAKKRRAERG